ncbi:cytochrome D1 domain-containing protein [Sulfuriflexus mobilis]|uniref:cytochrome D1 domain-containing protein n=1 Tax=Sulfuriflexus mobilis TaxID=1811807 RepID=UPI000F82C363|nr:cytochrome D1 domain-containing protein [Sulfuriflexus mobilis]
MNRFVGAIFFSYLSLISISSHAEKAHTEINAAQGVYQQHCASCHGISRLGGMGPALLPENLKRLRKGKALEVIKSGRAATQMPAFGEIIAPEQIALLAKYIYTPLPSIPHWGMSEIEKSHLIHYKTGSLGNKPVFKADMLNLFIVVELGDHHATLLDGDKFEAIHRFKTRFALHGGPKYSPDGRYVYFASRDGWISKFDIYNLKMVAEIRAGINTRNLAVSGDGRTVMVGNYLPHTLVVLDAENLKPIEVIPVKDKTGKTSRVSAVYAAAPRNSFIAALKDIPEVWEVYYNDKHEPVYNGLVHDYRQAEGIEDKGAFPIRRIPLDDYLDDFQFDQSYTHLMGAARNAKNGQVINLDIRRKVADLELTGLPHLGSGITWLYKGHPVMATPNLKKAEISIIDMTTWKTIKRIKTLGPGFFMRSHENSPYAWADVFFGPNKEAVHVIDKQSLEIIKTLRPSPGKNAAHVEFDRYGKHALLSVWDIDGELIVYNADTLDEIKRLPMKKPSGKYNVFNKINRSAGTSH